MVINGDDFGYSHDVNLAIISAHQSGILTSASLMVTGEAFNEAVELARENPKLGVGLHLVVGKGRSALPVSQVPHLVDSSGQFPSAPLVVGLRYQFNRAARRELRLEIEAQLQRFKETGLTLSHVDGHLHNHVHPYVLQCLVALSRNYGIHFIRLPYEELTLDWSTGSRPGPSQVILWSVFRLLRIYGVRLLSAHRIGYADRVYGLLHSGRITEAYLQKLIPLITADRVELYAHPSLGGNDNTTQTSNNHEQSEFHSLTSSRVSHLIAMSGFQRVTFTEL
ncbi:MAG: hypothetical protein ER33_09310 [Cyanobium sp. CACIAM 14]|nr:MAG: hypothetical protein ER33_09310 [Cyanobium sp. CACIAM 14]